MLPGHRCPLKTIIRHGTNTANKEIHRDKAWKLARNGENRTHYRVSGGPMMVTCHSKTLLSSTSPAENPSTGFFARSATINKQDARDQEPIAANRGDKGGENSEPFGSVPLSCFWSRRLAWLAVPAMGRKQCSSIGSGLGFWRWGVVRRAPGGAALFLGARAALESGRRGENGTGWTIYKKLERVPGWFG